MTSTQHRSFESVDARPKKKRSHTKSFWGRNFMQPDVSGEKFFKARGNTRPINLASLALCLVGFGCDTGPVLLTSGLSSTSSHVEGGLNAFPGAEGFGRHAQGGRGGDVYHVTNLDDEGEGSLRYGIEEMDGPRTIVFDVSGTIEVEDKIRVSDDYLTIAGQTAPGGGITLAGGYLSIGASHIIVRYIRSRLGDDSGGDDDAISVGGGSNIIFDHVSASWSVDETFSANNYGTRDLTIQWSLIAESLRYSHHQKGAHGYGGILGAGTGSYHHNLYAHHSSRSPKVSGRRHTETDFRNNVIYNWGYQSCYDGASSYLNWANNYYKAGPATNDGVTRRIFRLSDQEVDDENEGWEESRTHETALYAEGNYVDGYPGVTQDNWSSGIDFANGANEGDHRAHEPHDFPPISEQSAQAAYELVLASAGASLVRDDVDTRIVNEVRTGQASNGNDGIIDSQDDVGGWPQLLERERESDFDTDGDGMPDAWELSRGLDASSSDDRNGDDDGDGYTNLEEYLNGLVSEESEESEEPGEPVAGTIDAFSTIEAEDYDAMDGIRTQPSSEGTLNVGWIDEGEWLAFNSVDFGSGATAFEARVARRDGSISLRLDSVDGPEIGTLDVISSGGSQVYETQSTTVSGASGVHDLYLVFGGSGFNLNWFEFRGSTSLQAEDAILRKGVAAEWNHEGYRGSGFANFPSRKGQVKFKGIDGGDGGSATLTIRYANGSGDRSGRLIVNGARQSLTMESTGSWENWVSKSVPIELNSGTSNVIKFKSTGNDFGNLDEISISH